MNRRARRGPWPPGPPPGRSGSGAWLSVGTTSESTEEDAEEEDRADEEETGG